MIDKNKKKVCSQINIYNDTVGGKFESKFSNIEKASMNLDKYIVF